MRPSRFLGSTWIREPAGSGRFHCPRCGGERAFQRANLHRRLTISGRPMIRISADEAFLTCEDCGHAYPADDVAEAEDDRALAAVVAAVIFSDSAVRSTEKEVAREVIRRYTGRDLSPAGADELLRRSRKQWGDPGARLARLRHIVAEPVRRRIVEAAYHVCTADRELHPQESRFLEHIGEVLDLTPRQVRAAIETAKRNPLRAD